MSYSIKISFILLGFTVMFNQVINAQATTSGDLIELSIVDYSLIGSNNAPVTLSLSNQVGGTALSTASNSDLILKLSSICPPSMTRQVTSKISSGTVPTGTILKVELAPCTTTNSGGNLGTVSQAITLTTTDQNIITGIGSCYTGTGINDGYVLTYTWEPTTVTADYHLIKATSSNVDLTIVYTISAAN